MRSLLLVSLSDVAAVEAALASEADALVLDLEGAGLDGAARAEIRQAARDLLQSTQWSEHRPHLFVRLGDLDAPGFDADLSAVVAGEPDGILLAGSRTGADVQQLGAKLAVQEAEHGLAENEINILAEAGSHALGLFGLGSYAGASPRLIGLTWHAAAVAADLGSDDAAWPLPDFAPLQTARHLMLFAARAAAVAAVDTASRAGTDDAFLAECRLARQHGFNAKLATTPAQAAVINAVFGHA